MEQYLLEVQIGDLLRVDSSDVLEVLDEQTVEVRCVLVGFVLSSDERELHQLVHVEGLADKVDVEIHEPLFLQHDGADELPVDVFERLVLDLLLEDLFSLAEAVKVLKEDEEVLVPWYLDSLAAQHHELDNVVGSVIIRFESFNAL